MKNKSSSGARYQGILLTSLIPKPQDSSTTCKSSKTNVRLYDMDVCLGKQWCGEAVSLFQLTKLPYRPKTKDWNLRTTGKDYHKKIQLRALHAYLLEHYTVEA